MARITSMFLPRRGELYLVKFDPSVGAEIQKIRPALIIQNDAGNQYSVMTIVAAVSSKISDTLYPIEIFLPAEEGGVIKDSLILLNQIRSVDKIRLIKKLGSVSKETLAKVDIALKISLGIE